MSQHAAFRRQPVQQGAMQHTPYTIPAPVKGVVEIENWAYTAPGTALVLDNWFPTQRGIKLRGGTERWCQLPAKTNPLVNPGNSFTIFLTADEEGWAGYNLRQIAKPPAINKSGPAFRIQLQGAAAGEGTSIEEVFAGHCDADGNFTSPPVRVTFDSQTSFNIPALGFRYSDPITYPVVAGQHFAVSFYFSVADPSHAIVRKNTTGGLTNGRAAYWPGSNETDRLDVPLSDPETDYYENSVLVWTALDVYEPGFVDPPLVEPILSGIEYVSGNVHKMWVATPTRLFDVSFPDYSILEFNNLSNGHFGFAQLANQGGDWLLAVNDAGEPVKRFDGTSWVIVYPGVVSSWANSTSYAVNAFAKDTDATIWKCLVAHTSPATGTFASYRTANPGHWTSQAADGAGWITGPPGVPGIEVGAGLTYVWKYRNRLFFIQGGTMDAWYLPLNAVGGMLQMIPLSGAAKRGGSLLFGCSWSVDAGDGIDDKCCFFTDQGEVLIFTGNDPSSATAWRQEGRYDISRPLGKNGHCQLGGDVLVATVDGIVPLTACLQKDVAQLSLSAVSRNFERTWMAELRRKDAYPWSLIKWDEGDALYVNFPGGTKGKPDTLTVGVSNLHTGAWCRYTNHDAMCFVRYRGGLFFGTQDGKVMQCDSTGMDDGRWDVSTGKFEGQSYVCTMVGGWEMFKVPPNTVTWFQARAAFFARAREPFEPQLAACTDYEFRIPPAPDAGPDPGIADVWDQGLWDVMLWDAAPLPPAPVKNTMWVSIGETGFSHAPICQVTVGQQARPEVELLSISATFLRMGVNV